MTFFVSNSLKDKIDIEEINSQIEENKNYFSLSLRASNINYEISEIEAGETLKISIMLTQEIIEGFLKLNLDNKKVNVYAYNKLLYSFDSKEINIENFKSVDYSLIKTKIIITNYKNETQGDKNAEGNNWKWIDGNFKKICCRWCFFKWS